jgi:hypothetical protein
VQHSVHSGNGGPIFKIGGYPVGGVVISQKREALPPHIFKTTQHQTSRGIFSADDWRLVTNFGNAEVNALEPPINSYVWRTLSPSAGEDI